MSKHGRDSYKGTRHEAEIRGEKGATDADEIEGNDPVDDWLDGE